MAAALLANLASLSLCLPILWTVSPELATRLLPELLAVGAVLLGGGLLGLRAGRDEQVPPPTAQSRMFRFSHALGFALLVAALVLLSAGLSAWIGPTGAMAAAIVSAMAELHAAVATLGSLTGKGGVDLDQARWLMLGLLTASLVTKSGIALASGSRAYGLRVAAGLLLALAAGLLALLLT